MVGKMKRVLIILMTMCLSLSMSVLAFSAKTKEKKNETKTPEVSETEVAANEEEIVIQDPSVILAPGAIPNELGLEVLIVNGIGSVDSVKVQTVKGADYLFLPANANTDSLVFSYKAETVLFIEKGDDLIPISPDTPFDITPYYSKKGADGSFVIKLQAALTDGTYKEYVLTVMQSANIASLFVTSDDPVKKGLFYVESVKGNKGSGKLDLVNADNSVVYSGVMSQIKGRGNSTWAGFKKPFQIKLPNAFDLCQTGDPKNASKTWVLLANAYDATLARNVAAFDMAHAMGIEAPDYKPVDFYYDGMYLGSYLITEKVEASKGLINIDKNGYLLEMDIAYYAQEDNYFVDVTGTPFVIKNPEECSEEKISYIKNYMDSAMACAINGGTDPNTGLSVWDYIDMDSLARYYVFMQLVKNPDAFFSSTYFYLPSDGKLMAGPAWDYDSSFGVVTLNNYKSTTGFVNSDGWMSYFLNLPEFKTAIKDAQRRYGSPAALKEQSKVSSYVSMIGKSRKMNDALWRGIDQKYYTLPTYEQNVVYLKNYISGRNSYMNSHIGR